MPNERFMRHYYGASGYVNAVKEKPMFEITELHVRNINGLLTVSVSTFGGRWIKVYEEQLHELNEPVSFFSNAEHWNNNPSDEVLG